MESWVVFNAVILIWNAYFNVIKQSRHNEIIDTLQECFQSLMQVNGSYPITYAFTHANNNNSLTKYQES